MSYVKYYPDAKYGNRLIRNTNKYSYNTHVPRNFSILGSQKERVIFSEKHGGVITVTPINQIITHFDAQKKIIEILSNRKLYLDHPIGKYLIRFLDNIDKKYVNKFGITGSFLIDAQNEKSDIDLVCYGKSAYDYCKSVFSDLKLVTPYLGDKAVDLYNRRMVYPSSSSL